MWSEEETFRRRVLLKEEKLLKIRVFLNKTLSGVNFIK